MTVIPHSGRLARFFCCLISLLIALALPLRAADPAKTIVAEGLFGAKSGNDKKDAALTFISAALSLTDAVTNKQVVDAAKFKDGLGKIIDGTVQCLNASAWAK